MDNTSIQVFLTVAEQGSFRKAANILGYTQAGISYIVNGIEDEIGLKLFLRDKAGVHLSTEGKHLLPHIKQLEMDGRVLKQTVSEIKGIEQGSIRIVTFDSVSIHWLPDILHRFRQDFPGIEIELITEEDSLKAEDMVLTGEVDCGFFLTDVEANIDVYKLHEESVYAVVSSDHELADAKFFPGDRLGEYPYIAMQYESHTGVRRIFERFNASPNIAYTIDNDFAAIAMASKGLGYCIFPELLLQDVPFDVRCLEFDRPQKRTLSIGTRSIETASTACLKFIEYTMKWVQEEYR